jgi:hypothetical protein
MKERTPADSEGPREWEVRPSFLGAGCREAGSPDSPEPGTVEVGAMASAIEAFATGVSFSDNGGPSAFSSSVSSAIKATT